MRTSGLVPLRSGAALTAISRLKGKGFMRNVAVWIRGMRATSGAPVQALEDDRAAAILFVGSTTEPGPGAAPLASESALHRSPPVAGGVSVVDSEISGRITDAGIGR